MNTWNGLTEDKIIERIECGESLAAIAKSAKRVRSRLSEWLDGNPERSARAKAAREKAAAAWDELAETKITAARNQFQLAKAREIAHHYRWRASKINPKQYGDKQQVEHSGTLTLAQLVEQSHQPDA